MTQQDKLIEKCRLKEDEQYKYYNDSGLWEEHHWMIGDLLDAQLRKAIPLISAEARKQERDRLLGIYKTAYATEPGNAPAIILAALKSDASKEADECSQCHGLKKIYVGQVDKLDSGWRPCPSCQKETSDGRP